MSACGTALAAAEPDAAPHGDSKLVRRVRRVPVARTALEWRPVQHAASARRLGALVRESARFALADLTGVTGLRRYHLRRGGRPVLLRHGTIDIWTFNEIFLRRLYDPPSAVAAALARADPPRVVDLGANIGMFGVDLLSRYPRACVTAYEPDPANAAIHRRLIALNAAEERWQLVQACAGSEDGTVTFLSGRETASRIVEDDVAGTVDVPMEDVLPQLAAAELVKMDIEGAEWSLLRDPRLAQVRALVLEYHPHGCPGDDPAETAEQILRSHGFDITPVFHDPSGIGMLWATKVG
jgi:FkbM family methyltransferase